MRESLHPRAPLLIAALLAGCAPEDDETGDDTSVPTATDTPSDTAPDDTSVVPDPIWSTMAALMSARQEHGVAFLGAEIVVVGGLTPSDEATDPKHDGLAPTSSVEAYNPQTDRWRPLPPLPRPLHHPNLAVVGGKLIVAGFLHEMEFFASGDVHIYDPATGKWSEGTPMPEGEERGAALTFVHEGRVHVVGGRDADDARVEVSAYDPVADEWDALPPLAVARDHAMGGWIDGTYYVAGGRDVRFDDGVDAVEAWDPVGGWRSVASLPRARGGGVAGSVDGRLYVLGGEGNHEDPEFMFHDVDVYDPGQDAWTPLAPMPLPIHGAGAVSHRQRVWIPGGATRAGARAIDTLQVFFPDGE